MVGLEFDIGLQRETFFFAISALEKGYEIFFYQTGVRSLATIVTNSLTTNYDCYLVDLVDVTLSCEDANSKLVEAVDVDDEDRVVADLEADVWS